MVNTWKMGKNKGGIPQKEQFQRMQYLYQAANQCIKSDPRDLNLCRFYLTTMRSIAKKSVLRLHVDIKRTMCKKCCVLLIPGVTAIVRTKSKKEKHLVVTCLECDTVKRFLLRKDYKLWLDNPQAWLDHIQPITDFQSANKKQNNEVKT
ncbi:ribonuclease P protein subunit p21-like isoform X2 [Mytilus galloprovincialis]|uniref:ribonuclease P protein subunit p21-like isoform X2 n=1 Tax=Mytilus galloprovincialis TaxID=29158 RepID=UPI003F7B3D38